MIAFLSLNICSVQLFSAAPSRLMFELHKDVLFLQLKISVAYLASQCLQRNRFVTQLCLQIWSGGMPVLLASH
jgi:hypothetical protein